MIITKNANVLITSFILMSRLALSLSLSLASRSTNPCSILIRLRLSIEYEIIAPDFRMKFMKNGIDNEWPLQTYVLCPMKSQLNG